MNVPAKSPDIGVGGFVDHHTHLLKASSGVPFPWKGMSVREFHQQVARDGSTPMDVAEPVGLVAPA
jgi:hypothetical protein